MYRTSQRETTVLIENVPPSQERLNLTDTIAFDCHKGLSCFGTCCRNRDLVLTPYDVLRLKRALNLHSDAFLEQLALYRVDPASGFPVISLRMEADEQKTE